MDSAGRLSTDSGLNTALLTCQDYVEEVAWVAQPRVYGMFQRCLLRHLACCVAARMLCSAHPYDHAWQKGVAVEIQRIRSFAQRIERADHEAAETYLGMLSLLRTLLCAPDAFSVSAAYNTVRFEGRVCLHVVPAHCWCHRSCSCARTRHVPNRRADGHAVRNTGCGALGGGAAQAQP